MRTQHKIALAILLAVIGAGYLGKRISDSEVLKTTLQYVHDDLLQPASNHNLMLGSSSIKRLSAETYIPCKPWTNRGISNARISDIFRYISLSPLAIDPEHILIYAGENDISAGIPVSDVTLQYQALAATLRERYRDAKLHIIAITATTTLIIHKAIVLQLPIARLLFNGKRSSTNHQ